MRAMRHSILLVLALSVPGGVAAAEKAPATAGSSDKTQKIRQLATSISPGPTAAQTSRHGLRLPEKIDAARPVVVLIHGLDSSDGCWGEMTPLLEQAGCQVAYFNYPNDQSIALSGQFLADEVRQARRRRPTLKLDLVAHSMGGLVARWFVEGSKYKGGVRRLILLATPNHGSEFSRGSCCSELWEQFNHWRSQPGWSCSQSEWSWTWSLTDGLGEAGSEMRPGSAFLTALNALPRRKGVRYSVVYGNRNCGWRYGADSLDYLASKLPGCEMGQCMSRSLSDAASSLRSREGASDGLVTAASAQLDGVKDQVALPADHVTLCCGQDGQTPMAWPALRQRLALDE